MPDLKTRFDDAVAQAKAMTRRPDNVTLLALYGLYKQGSLGDNTEKQPGFSDLVARVKWEAWHQRQGMPAEQAMQQYLDLFATVH